MEDSSGLIFVYGIFFIVVLILSFKDMGPFIGLKPMRTSPEEINAKDEVSDDKIKLIERIVTEVKDDKLKHDLLREVIKEKPTKEGKPEGFWKGLCDSEDDDFNRRMSLGLLHSGIRTMDRTGGYRMK